MAKAIAVAGAAAFALPLLIILLASASPASQGTGRTGPGSATAAQGAALGGAPTATARTSIPAAYLAWYRDAARTCPGLPWGVLAGIGEVESDHGRSDLPGVHSGANYAGARGPMQFEPGTFAQYAVNANPARPLSPYDPADAIYTAAAMLCAKGARGGSATGVELAIFAYNHAGWYVSEVLQWAARYAARGGAHVAATPSDVVTCSDGGQLTQEPRTGQDVPLDPAELASASIATRSSGLPTKP